MSNSSLIKALSSQNAKVKQSPQSKITVFTAEKVGSENKDLGRSVHVVIKNGKCFVPTQAKTSGMITFLTDPIHVCELTVTDLEKTITMVLFKERTIISEEEEKRLFMLSKSGKHPLYVATKSLNSRNLSATSATYAIETSESKSKWKMYSYGPGKKEPSIQEFPISTSSKQIAEVIIEDVQKYPDLLQQR